MRGKRSAARTREGGRAGGRDRMMPGSGIRAIAYVFLVISNGSISNKRDLTFRMGTGENKARDQDGAW